MDLSVLPGTTGGTCDLGNDEDFDATLRGSDHDESSVSSSDTSQKLERQRELQEARKGKQKMKTPERSEIGEPFSDENGTVRVKKHVRFTSTSSEIPSDCSISSFLGQWSSNLSHGDSFLDDRPPRLNDAAPPKSSPKNDTTFLNSVGAEPHYQGMEGPHMSQKIPAEISAVEEDSESRGRQVCSQPTNAAREDSETRTGWRKTVRVPAYVITGEETPQSLETSVTQKKADFENEPSSGPASDIAKSCHNNKSMFGGNRESSTLQPPTTQSVSIRAAKDAIRSSSESTVHRAVESSSHRSTEPSSHGTTELSDRSSTETAHHHTVGLSSPQNLLCHSSADAAEKQSTTKEGFIPQKRTDDPADDSLADNPASSSTMNPGRPASDGFSYCCSRSNTAGKVTQQLMRKPDGVGEQHEMDCISVSGQGKPVGDRGPETSEESVDGHNSTRGEEPGQNRQVSWNSQPDAGCCIIDCLCFLWYRIGGCIYALHEYMCFHEAVDDGFQGIGHRRDDTSAPAVASTERTSQRLFNGP